VRHCPKTKAKQNPTRTTTTDWLHVLEQTTEHRAHNHVADPAEEILMPTTPHTTEPLDNAPTTPSIPTLEALTTANMEKFQSETTKTSALAHVFVPRLDALAFQL